MVLSPTTEFEDFEERSSCEGTIFRFLIFVIRQDQYFNGDGSENFSDGTFRIIGSVEYDW